MFSEGPCEAGLSGTRVADDEEGLRSVRPFLEKIMETLINNLILIYSKPARSGRAATNRKNDTPEGGH